MPEVDAQELALFAATEIQSEALIQAIHITLETQ